MSLPLNHSVRAYAVVSAGQMISRGLRSSADGRTGYELRKAKAYKRALPPFGETVMYVLQGKSRQKHKDCVPRPGQQPYRLQYDDEKYFVSQPPNVR